MQLDALCHLTAYQLNEVYDQLDWAAASNEEEESNKSKLIAWILRNMPELKHPTRRMQTKQLIEASMALRGVEGDPGSRMARLASKQLACATDAGGRSSGLVVAAPVAPRKGRASKKRMAVVEDSVCEGENCRAHWRGC